MAGSQMNGEPTSLSRNEYDMIITVVTSAPLVGVATDDEHFVMVYGLDGDWDNPERFNYRKMLEGGAIGFPNGREWDGTPEDALRLYDLGVVLLESEIESGKTGEPDEVEGYLL